jgi:ribosomal protein S18 acetylase RimI-like enzyme
MIRQATIDDYQQITQIKESLFFDITKISDPSYRVESEKKGFLHSKDQSSDAFKKDIQKIFPVYEEAGIVKGYIRVDEEQEIKSEDEVFWFRPEFRDVYFSLPHANTGGVAVAPDINQRGIGTQLLVAAEREVRAKSISYLFASVTLSPITNIASLLFHEKNGFERLALVTLPELFGMKNYQCFLYGKKL